MQTIEIDIICTAIIETIGGSVVTLSISCYVQYDNQPIRIDKFSTHFRMSIELADLNTVTEHHLNELKSSNHLFINQYWQLLRKELKEIFTIHPREWLNAFRPNPNYPLFGKGDIDGFIALLVNTLATLLAVILNLQPILGHHIVYGKIMPGYSDHF